MSSLAQVKGLKELQAALDQVPAKVEANIMRGALRAGAKPVLKAAQDNLRQNGSVDTGDLLASLRITSSRVRRGTVTTSIVAGGERKNKPKVWYAHIVEGGAIAHVIRARNGKLLAIGVPSVDHPGFAGKPFLRPAFDSQATAAVQAVREYVRERLATKHGLNVPAPLEEGDE